MLTMPERVRAIKHAIEERQDFSVLANGGEAEVFAYARSIGMRGGALVLEWQETFRQRQAVVATGQRETGVARCNSAVITNAVTTSRIATQSLDLDYWPDVEAAEPTDDDGDEEPCEACHGTGFDAGGAACRVCRGSGKILNEDDDDEREFEDEE